MKSTITMMKEAGIDPTSIEFQMSQMPPTYVNGWKCSACNRTLFAIHLDYGTTPYLLNACNYRDEDDSICNQHKQMQPLARSFGYNKECKAFSDVVTHEWYRPETLDALNASAKAHVLAGGLLLRKKK